MITNSVEKRVVSVIQEVLRVDSAKIVPTSSIKEDLGADSLDQVSLIMALESEFNSSITDEDAETLLTVGDIINYIKVESVVRAT